MAVDLFDGDGRAAEPATTPHRPSSAPSLKTILGARSERAGPIRKSSLQWSFAPAVTAPLRPEERQQIVESHTGQPQDKPCASGILWLCGPAIRADSQAWLCALLG